MAELVRILYVDDDVGLGILLNRALAPSGYRVEAVVSGEDAMARLKDQSFDLIALDHNLTNEVGLDLIPRIRALPQAPPIIYVTGSEDARIAVAALKAGAVDYVWKDVQGHYRELLRQSIQTALEQEKLKRAAATAQREVEVARDRAETLLREVNHRVANSLAIVSSFVQMQANAISDPQARDMLRETQARIAAIASVHRRLYTSDDVRSVEVNVYLASLVEELSAAMNVERRNALRLISAPSEVQLATDKAIALGVIVTELVTNAFKYAYGEGSGEVRIRASAQGGTLAVTVEDDGVGWTGEGEIKGSGLGSRIIRAMAQTAQAAVNYDAAHDISPGGGTRAVITVAIWESRPPPSTGARPRRGKGPAAMPPGPFAGLFENRMRDPLHVAALHVPAMGEPERAVPVHPEMALRRGRRHVRREGTRRRGGVFLARTGRKPGRERHHQGQGRNLGDFFQHDMHSLVCFRIIANAINLGARGQNPSQVIARVA